MLYSPVHCGWHHPLGLYKNGTGELSSRQTCILSLAFTVHVILWMLKFLPATASASVIDYTSDLWIQTNPFSARLLLFGILSQQQDARTEGGHFGDSVTGGMARAAERKLVKRSRRLGRPHTCITLAPPLFSPFPSLTATWPVLCSIVLSASL